HRAGVAATQQVGERLDQIAAHLAAQAAGRERDDAVVALLDQLVIEADLAKLVDDDGRSREVRLAQQMTEQRGLAAAEKAGEEENRNHDATSDVTATRTLLRA